MHCHRNLDAQLWSDRRRMEEHIIDFRVGLLGELQVEQRLVEHGWHPVRLDTAQMASNADLLAINRHQRVSIQVKTTNAGKQHAHSNYLGFGYATNHLRDGNKVFNSKKSPLIADLVVGVSYSQEQSRFVVLPVALAENLCVAHAKYWHNVPLKNGGIRTTNFPLYLCFTANPIAHAEHHAQMKRNLVEFENAWHLLHDPIEKLHDAQAWRIQ